MNKEHAIACVTSAKEEALHFAGRDLILDYAKSHTPSSASNAEPSNRLYFAKFADGENALRQVMESHGNNIVSIYFREYACFLHRNINLTTNFPPQ